MVQQDLFRLANFSLQGAGVKVFVGALFPLVTSAYFSRQVFLHLRSSTCRSFLLLEEVVYRSVTSPASFSILPVLLSSNVHNLTSLSPPFIISVSLLLVVIVHWLIVSLFCLAVWRSNLTFFPFCFAALFRSDMHSCPHVDPAEARGTI